jgi:hypothetical protein
MANYCRAVTKSLRGTSSFFGLLTQEQGIQNIFLTFFFLGKNETVQDLKNAFYRYMLTRVTDLALFKFCFFKKKRQQKL